MSLWEGFFNVLSAWGFSRRVSITVTTSKTGGEAAVAKEKIMDPVDYAPPPELPRFQRPVGPDVPVSSRYGAKGPWWDWHYDAPGKFWKQGVMCSDCATTFRMFDTASLCKCGKRNGLGQHRGIDFQAPIGTMVFAMMDGSIEAAGFEGVQNHKSGFGLRVRQSFMVGKQLWKCWYGHLSEVKVQSGQRVVKGDLIGLTGETGRATGPHLCCEVRNPDNQPVAFQFIEEVKNV
jgi:murein DD-endopeptidase MepM/ murein hydrolase activator NlpD